MTTIKKDDRIIVKFGLGGHGEILAYTRSAISGYCSPDNFVHNERDIAKYEHCTFIDMRDVFDKKASLAFTMPMCGNLDLEDMPDKCDRCPKPSMMLAMGVSGQFQQLLALNELQRQTKVKYSGLDTVAPSVFIGICRDNGGRIGKLHNGAIEWEGEA